MSLYNMLFGQNQDSGLLLKVIGSPDVGRFRDAWVEMREDEPVVAIYTRNGGGNRECYCETDEEHWEGCLSTTIELLQAHELYLSDSDDDFDCTYATFYFRVPDRYRLSMKVLAFAHQEEWPADKFQGLIAKLQSGDNKDDPVVRHALQVGEAILKLIVDEIHPQ